MDYLLGALGAVVFFGLCGGIYYIGYRAGKKKPVHNVDDKELRKQKQLADEFKEVFNYDLPQALQRKKVNHE